MVAVPRLALRAGRPHFGPWGVGHDDGAGLPRAADVRHTGDLSRAVAVDRCGPRGQKRRSASWLGTDRAQSARMRLHHRWVRVIPHCPLRVIRAGTEAVLLHGLVDEVVTLVLQNLLVNDRAERKPGNHPALDDWQASNRERGGCYFGLGHRNRSL